jgi:translocation and assembly module TamA
VHFNSGPRYRIGEIQVEQAFLDPAIVAGYLEIETGSYFDSNTMAHAYRDLSDSAYFGRIEVRPDMERAADEQIPIRISLTPGNRTEYTVGVGASTDTGLRFRAGFRNNRINQRGHRLIADLGVSTVIQGLTVEYRIPLGDPRREWFSFTGALSNEETDSFDNEAQRLGVRWTKAMSDTWLRTLAVDFSNESFHVGTDIDTSRTVVPSISFDHKQSDRDIFPRYGRRLGAKLRGTDQALSSNTSYIQATASLRLIHSFGSGNRIIGRVNAGATASSNFAELPPSVRFFAGGDESVRGFDYESLGPKDTEGNVIGGDNLLVASVEYERLLRGNFYGAVFVDAGNAFNGTDFDAEAGTGLGLIWRSPLGPIRLYLGYPLTADDRGIRLHLRLGADL